MEGAGEGSSPAPLPSEANPRTPTMMTRLRIPAELITVLWIAILTSCGHPGGRTEEIPARADAIEVAVVPFGLAAGTPPPPVDVAEVIRRDLASSGRIVVLPEEALPERPARLSEVRFEAWRDSIADVLVIGLVAGVHDGGHEVEFRLVDPRVETRERATLVGYVVASAPDALLPSAHRIASMIAERLVEEVDPSRSQ